MEVHEEYASFLLELFSYIKGSSVFVEMKSPKTTIISMESWLIDVYLEPVEKMIFVLNGNDFKICFSEIKKILIEYAGPEDIVKIIFDGLEIALHISDKNLKEILDFMN